jgi:hypothetical protein
MSRRKPMWRPERGSLPLLVDYLLFVDEAPLTAPVRGTTGLPRAFLRRVRDEGAARCANSLDARLMRYPCSYMISSAFEQLPATVRDAVYERLFAVLSGKVSDTRYARLTAADRRAVLEILHDTKSDWRF